MYKIFKYVLPWCILLNACKTNTDNQAEAFKQTLFVKLSSDQTGISFKNSLTSKADFDVFRYRNFYNGGGVAIGDINNDGLSDVYLTSNMGSNKLYLNKGDFKFEDITQKAGVSGIKVWSTGVSMADVNADGLLDIYVCNSGGIKGDNRENELFINNGDLTFSEKAKEYGLDEKGFSTHAAFFDYDKDGDLDCYVLNNSFKPIGALGYKNLRNERDPLGGHKLFRNDNGFFNDVSEQAGIFGSVIGFGLGVTVGDINHDNWLDIYVSNDFYERDYLYINNHDGTFSERLPEYMGHISMFSMGADLADINNDGYPDVFSTDMLPKDDYRLKTLIAFETYDVYQLRQKNGYYHQFMRNMLHLNNQDGTFSEIGQLAGIEATDWSWGALIADFNNDSNKEIFVCNGIYKDVIDQDFVEFLGNSQTMHDAIDGKKVDFKNFVDKMPSVKLSNCLFVSDSALHYSDRAAEWGLDEPSFSNGAAYGDLDNDGDLDLIINNVNQELFIYQNNARQLTNNNYLSISFIGKNRNSFGVGANVKIYGGDQIIYYENIPIRGFQSSMDYKMTIGLGKTLNIDSLYITWPNDSVQVLRNVPTNKHIVVNQNDATSVLQKKDHMTSSLVSEIKVQDVIQHNENTFNDFDRDRLIYHMLSTQGPAFTVGDLNGDDLDDFFIGGSIGSSGKIYLQTKNGNFNELATATLKTDSLSDQVDAVFFDADNDGDLDLYVVTGGSEYTGQSIYNLDKFYENKGLKNGSPVFELTTGRLPPLYQSGSCVKPVDIDNDGDLDLFVGTRSLPSYYGMPCDQFILINDGNGNFAEVNATFAPGLKQLGMVTDALWFDYDDNGFKDLIVVGEWMTPTIFTNNGSGLKKLKHVEGLDRLNGWWNVIESADLDHDGDMDFVVGNMGLNSKFRPTLQSPITTYVNDFDQNGSIEPIFSFSHDGKEYPMALRQDMVKQMSSIKKRFLYYKDYAKKTNFDFFDKDLLSKSTILKFDEPRTSILINDGNRGFKLKPLPFEAQYAPVYGIEIVDINNDNMLDIILGGNLFAVKPEAGRYDAMHGLVLLGDKKNNFSPLNSQHSGLKVDGEIRHIHVLRSKDRSKILAVVLNDDATKFYTIK